MKGNALLDFGLVLLTAMLIALALSV